MVVVVVVKFLTYSKVIWKQQLCNQNTLVYTLNCLSVHQFFKWAYIFFLKGLNERTGAKNLEPCLAPTKHSVDISCLLGNFTFVWR